MAPLLRAAIFVTAFAVAAGALPNILFIVADDYGYNDVGYHGSELETPAIDALASEGVKLENYYVLPLCTPTRSAFLSSRFPFRTGLQTSTISPAKPYGMHLNYSTLADELRTTFGYATAALGKWHLGFCREEFAPHRRGFDSFNGYMNGAESYFTHIRPADRVSFNNFTSGYDFYGSGPGATGVGNTIDWTQNATGPLQNTDPLLGSCYSAHELAHRAAIVVREHDSVRGPLFMYLAFQSVHSPYEAPQAYVDKYAWMNDSQSYSPINPGRPLYGGMVAALDEAVANVTHAFRVKGGDLRFWNNTLMIFTTDNGGVDRGNNWPLRGRKATLWEGGTRAVGFMRGWGLQRTGYSSTAMHHAVDWLPTLLSAAAEGTGVSAPAAGATPSWLASRGLKGIDGVDNWPALSRNASSARTRFVYNIEPKGLGTKGMKCGAVRMGCHKLIKGDPGSGTYDPKPQQRPASARATFAPLPAEQANDVYRQHESLLPHEAGPWLFDLCTDPNERNNLYNDTIVAAVQAQLETMLQQEHSKMVPALHNTMADDYRFNPSLHNGTWTWWGCSAN